MLTSLELPLKKIATVIVARVLVFFSVVFKQPCFRNNRSIIVLVNQIIRYRHSSFGVAYQLAVYLKKRNQKRPNQSSMSSCYWNKFTGKSVLPLPPAWHMWWKHLAPLDQP